MTPRLCVVKLHCPKNPCNKNATLLPDLTEALEAAMEHMKEMDWEAILEKEDMNREGFEYEDDDEEESVEQ